MKEINKNKYYELSYDEDNNWIHWKMIGFWENMGVVPDFDKDWDTIQGMVQPGFKIFGDLSELKTMPEEVRLAQDQRQGKLMQAGCKKVAVIVDSSITKMSLNKALVGSGMDKIVRYCENKEEVESFLNAD